MLMALIRGGVPSSLIVPITDPAVAGSICRPTGMTAEVVGSAGCSLPPQLTNTAAIAATLKNTKKDLVGDIVSS